MKESPVLPIPPTQYSVEYMDQLLRVLRLYFSDLDAVTPVRAATLNIDLRTLPTEADVADLRTGDVYRDSTANNVLKVKV